jgi:7-cyano-7-deazaguanine tRNA-ribosyltransferase
LEIVAGLSLKQLEPRVWDPQSPFYLPGLTAVMLSFSDFDRTQKLCKQAMDEGIHKTFDIPERIRVYLDNGAFSKLRSGRQLRVKDYRQFVEKARPHWYPIPADFIPLPDMNEAEQRKCFSKTMYYNRVYSFDGYVPVVHAGPKLSQYLKAICTHQALSQKTGLALGALVPQLLQTKGTGPKTQVVDSILSVRQKFIGKIHAFGIGGTATLHLAAVLGLDSVDSAGWRNRAARGIIQLPGRGDRLIAPMGSWEGRKLNRKERALLADCPCPGCCPAGLRGLTASGTIGFARRATHNLHVLLKELKEIEIRLQNKSYSDWYPTHVFNSVFLALIEYALQRMDETSAEDQQQVSPGKHKR